MDIFDSEHLGSGPVSPQPPSEGPSSKKSVGELQKQLDRQRLLIEVLVRALIEKGLYTRDQLNALANLVDMEDGVRDGRRKPNMGIKHCANCGRVRLTVSGKCLYCEHEEVMDLV